VLEISEVGIRAAKATKATSVNTTNNINLVLGKTLVVGLVPVSTFVLAAFATPVITDIAPPSLAPQHFTTA
jgi:hypothetical protein